MKNGKVLAKLALDKRVASLTIHSDDQAGSLMLADGFYSTTEPARRRKSFTTAKQAHAFIKSAKPMPVAREGYKIVTNMMTGLPVEEAIGTPYTCSVASESYWCN